MRIGSSVIVRHSVLCLLGAGLSFGLAPTCFGIGTSSYVQSGLIAHWDGIDNAGVGKHDAAATVWKDLKNGREFSLTGVTVEDDRLVFAGTSSSYGLLPLADTTATFNVVGAGGTIEVVLRSADGASAVALQSTTASGVVISRFNTCSIFSISSKPYSTWYWKTETNTVSVGYSSATPVSIAANGSDKAFSDKSDYWTSDNSTGTMIGTRVSRSNSHFKGSIYAIRLYDRALTAEERLANARVDSMRFHIDAPDDRLDIAAEPSCGQETLSPNSAGRSELEADQEVSVSAGNVDTEDVRAFCTGWKLFDRDGALVDSGAQASFIYRHPNPAVYRRLEWQYAVSNRVTVAGEGATYDPVSQWVKKGDRAEITFTPEAGKAFHSVAGDPEATVSGTKLTTGPVQGPLALTVTYAGALSVDAGGDDENGTGSTDKPFATVARALTELNGNPGAITVNKGDYPLTAAITVTTDVKIRGATGKPEDVRFYRLRNAKNDNYMRIFSLDHAAASVENCTIEDGQLSSSGVGVLIGSNGGQVINCILRNHYLNLKGGWGTVIHSSSANAIVSRCVITNNTSSSYDNYYGCAVYLGGGRIDNSIVGYHKTTSTPWGSGALVLDGSAVAEHCTVYGNNCYSAAGIVLASANAKAVNCLVFGNVTKGGRPEDTCWSIKNNNLVDSGKVANFINCVFDKYTPNTDTCYAGVEVLTADPANDDIRLTPGSKAVDFGTDANCVSTLDLAGNPRASGAARDAGCYELQQDGFLAGFKTDKLNGLIPSKVKFSAVTFGAPEGDEITYKWDFDNDGTYETTTSDASVSYTYETAGTYAVKLLAVSKAMGEKALVIPGFFTASSPRVYVVKGNVGAAAPYATWATAAANVPEAVASAGIGAEVIVSNGTYQISATIALNHAMTLRGFTGRPEDVVIDAQKKCRAVTLNNDAGETVCDLTIENGKSDANGPGVAILGGGMVSNCIVRGCYNGAHHAASMAVSCESAYGLVTHCVITNNSAGIYDGNYSAAAYVSAGRIANSLIAWNKTATNLKHGGMLTLDGSAVAENCTVVKNISAASAGINLASATAKAKNCVVAANVTSGSRSEDICWSIRNRGGTEVGKTANFINCVFDKYAPNTDTCYAGAELMFVDAEGGNFRPTMSSKAVGFGTSDILDEATVDLDGLPRRNDVIDAGCWEYQAGAFEAGFTGDKIAGFLPATVNCTAIVSGAGDDDELAYYWDFDNDGVFDVTTSVKTVAYTYREAGFYDARLVVTNKTAGGAVADSGIVKNFFKANPKTLYVVKDNPGATVPYATWATAAADIQAAIDVAAEGATVIVSNGLYEISSQIAIRTPITLCGLTGRPEDVIVDAKLQCRALDVNAGPSAFVHSMTLRNGVKDSDNGGGVNVYNKGGSVSNLVVSGCRTEGKWAAGTLYFANENCHISHCVVTNCICAVGTDGGYVSGIIHLNGGATASHCIVSRCGYKAPYYSGHYNAAICVTDGSAEWCTVVSNEMHAVGGINVAGSGAFRYCLIAGNRSVYKPDSPRHQVWGALNKYPDGYADFDDTKRATDATILARQQTNVSDRVQISGTSRCAAGGLAAMLPKFEQRGLFTQGRESPGLNAVSSSAAPAMPATDVFGNPRKVGRGYDLGAVESKIAGFGIIVR